MRRACLLFLNAGCVVCARLLKSDIINTSNNIPDFADIDIPYKFNAHVFLDNTKIYANPEAVNVKRELNNYNPNSPIGGFILDNKFDDMDDEAFECYLKLSTKYTEDVTADLFQNQIKNKEER